MGTRPRKDPEDGWHHITCHRVEDGDLFLDDTDRWCFLKFVAEAAEKFSVHVISYCLMGNHYHLLVRCPGAGVSRFMHHVNGRYASMFNHRHGRTGRLFSDAFANVLIGGDGQLLFTTRYIDRNPLELGIDIRRYPWSTYQAYLNPDQPSRVVRIHATVPLNIAGGAAAYRSFVETDNPADKFSIERGKRVVLAKPPRAAEDVLAELVALCDSLTPDSSVRPRSHGHLRRAAAVLVAHENGLATGAEIRLFFGFGTMHAYTSFLYRAQRKERTAPAFFAQVRHAWSNGVLANTRRSA